MVEPAQGAQPEVQHRWDLRFRARDTGGGSWGTVDPGYPTQGLPVLEWSVSRSRNSPATAQIVVDPYLLSEAEQNALLEMMLHGDGRHQKWGVSCFRDDFPEADQHEPVFFGPIRTVDIPADGPITLQAEDMSSILKEIVVGDYTTGDNPLSIERILGGLSGAWSDAFPDATGVTWRVEGVADRTLAVEAKDTRTLAEVVSNMAEEAAFEFYHDAGVNIVVRHKHDSWYYRPGKGYYLEGTAATRLFGPESEATIVVASGEEMHPNQDPDEEARKKEPLVPVNVVQRVAAGLAPGQFHQAFPYPVPTKGHPGTVTAAAKSVLERMLCPALSAQVRFEHAKGTPDPRPGMLMPATVPTPMFDIDGATRRNVHFEGIIQSVTITENDVQVDVVSVKKNKD